MRNFTPLISIVFLISFLFTSKISAQTNIYIKDQKGSEIFQAKTIISTLNGDIIFRGFSNKKGIVSIIDINNFKEKVRLQINAFGFQSIDKFVTLEENIYISMNEKTFNKDEVIVTAQYKKQNVAQSIHKVSIINREKIDAMAAINLRDILSNEIGIRISQDNILGSNMTLQGISGENVKILIDGVPVIGRLGGNIDLSQINLQEIDHIEVVEGPLSVNYGTNALAGVVNLISKQPTFRKFKSNITSYYESSGHFNLVGSVNYGSKFHSLGASGGRNFFDGWSDHHKVFRNPEPIADSNRFMTWKPKEQVFGNIYYQFMKNNYQIKYKMDVFNEVIINRGYPRPPYQESAFDDKYITRRIDQSLFLSKEFKNKGAINSLFSFNRYNRNKNTYFTDLTNLSSELSNNESDQDTSVFDQWVFRGNYTSTKDSNKINFQIGYDVLIESAEGRRILNNRQEQYDYAIFASFEYKPNNLITVKPGIRYSYNTTYSTPILPSLNLKWSISNQWTLRSSYARGFRAPSIKELYFEFIDINHNIVGNENLKAESSNNFSGAITNNLSFNLSDINLELNAFYNSIKNRISLANIQGTQFSYTNIGLFKSTGCRFLVRLKNNKLNSKIAFGLTGTASNVISPSLVNDFNDFLFYPDIQTSIIYSIKKIKTTFGLFYKYQGKLPNFRIDENNVISQSIINDYHLLDFTITKKIWENNISLNCGVKNILNVTQVFSNANNDIHSSSLNSVSVGTGRTYFVSLKLNLSKSLK
ncbi:MAG: hypothetical protein CL844_07260 [Crocinitomicaceae bacterium]|nr:hypothetical protein [Crocinitomicaceae bacterium]|tara:strand:- start:23376 stop:25652 length:2277 start_codon:yes stop_codon:yes gene_type:complete